MFFKRFFSRPPDTRIAREVYAVIVAKARQPYFYARLGVPDTVDGRFDMIALHAILLMNRLARGSATAKNLSQKIFDAMFADMDRSLREMGVGDLSVGAEVRKMAEAFYGRAKAYREALDGGDLAALERALARNIYGEQTNPEHPACLARYVAASARALEDQSEAEIVAGRVAFPDAETYR